MYALLSASLSDAKNGKPEEESLSDDE